MDDHVIAGRSEDAEKERIQKEKEAKVNTDSGKKFLQTTRVSSLFPEGRMKIITMNGGDHLNKAFETLIEHKILSVPVWENRKRAYTSFIDMLDIVSFCMSEIESAEQEDQSVDQLLHHEMFMKRTCSEVAGTSGRNPYYPVDKDAPLQAAMDVMVAHKMHRIPVVDAMGTLETIVSQSQVIALLNKHLNLFPIRTQTVQELNLGFKDVISVNIGQRAIDAFKIIFAQKVSGVAVVNDAGELVGNISASDLSLVDVSSRIKRLFLPLEKFLQLIPPRVGHVAGVHSVLPSATFGDVMEKITETRSHRIYVISPFRKPIGVISLVDAIEAIINSV